ncbi:hypothetical protein MMC22_003147 [Lobaria immixta]|nr:hypothetical protein [Lobaria immixta]
MLVLSSPWDFLLLCFCVVESKTITSTIISTVPSPSSTQVPPTYSSDADFRSSVLNSTNFYRKQHNASDLTWNNSLATYAASYAEKCLWEHSVRALPAHAVSIFAFLWCPDSSQHGPSGENLAESYPNITAAIEAWGNERGKYDFDRPTGFSKATGHFTQLVWKDTKSVGCGRKQCDNGDTDGAHGWLVVCEYWPAGNVDGEYKSEVQEQHKASNILGDVSRGSTKIVSWKLVMCGLAVAAGLRLS